MTKTAAISRTVAACIQLDDLRDWHMLGPKLDAARESVRGGPGITEAELAALEGYADAWRNLRRDLRAFYRALCCSDETVSCALWRVLHGGPALAGWQEARLRALWTDATCLPPSFDLVPIRRRN